MVPAIALLLAASGAALYARSRRKKSSAPAPVGDPDAAVLRSLLIAEANDASPSGKATLAAPMRIVSTPLSKIGYGFFRDELSSPELGDTLIGAAVTRGGARASERTAAIPAPSEGGPAAGSSARKQAIDLAVVATTKTLLDKVEEGIG